MASKPQVTLTFAGDTAQLESSFDRVGESSRAMDRDVQQAAGGFDRAAEAADAAENRAQGVASTLTGTADTAAGVGLILKGNLFEGFVTAGGGLADLAEGFNYTLIPAMQGAVNWLKGTRVATLATAAAQKVAAVGSKIWAGAQWLLNAALLANPIGLVVLAIVALVAIFIIAWKRSETFRAIVTGAWKGIQAAALAVWRWFSGTLWPGIRGIIDRLADAFRSLPSRIASAFRVIASIVSAPFRAGFNAVSRAWNSTVGRLHWSVPGWVPFIGGNSFSAPRLPTFHSGGVVPGPPGREMLAILQAGETVTPAGAGNGGVSVVVSGGAGGSTDRMASELVLHLIRTGALRLQVSNGRVVVP